MQTNRWELYSTKKGWRKVSGEISRAVRAGIAIAKKAHRAGKSREDAVEEGMKVIDPILWRHRHFGAADSEPLFNTRCEVEKAIGLRDARGNRILWFV